MDTAELHYELPRELIAQHPCEKRDESRLLVLDRGARMMHCDTFRNFAQYLRPGDCVVMNDTRVIRARLHGQKDTGGKVEIFLLREESPGVWESLVRPSARVKPGTQVHIHDGIRVDVRDVLPNGRRRVVFNQPDVLHILEEAGEIPLPPYIERPQQDASDLRRYQTVYAKKPGAVAAPTAGLHFTKAVLRDLEEKGVERIKLTLHVGYGTFKPITAERLEDHQLEAEEFELSPDAADQLNNIRGWGNRVIAVGTTSTRVLESQHRDGLYHSGQGRTGHYIYPPYRFRGVDALLTNFHLPRSSLLALVCAFADTDFVMEAYRLAIQERFRFYSYGDAMLIL